MIAKKSHEAKNDTAKLRKVQDQSNSSVEVKKSFISLTENCPNQLLKAHLCLSCASSVLVYVLILPCFEINLPVKQNIFSKKLKSRNICKTNLTFKITFLGLRVHDSHNSRGFAEWVPPTNITLHLKLIGICCSWYSSQENLELIGTCCS